MRKAAQPPKQKKLPDKPLPSAVPSRRKPPPPRFYCPACLPVDLLWLVAPSVANLPHDEGCIFWTPRAIPFTLAFHTDPAMSQRATRIYKPVGRCIYCRCVPLYDVKLTKEHIIALSLGGYPILPESSCTDCARITHDFETIVTRDLLLPARTHLQIRSRRPKERPQELSTTDDDVELLRHPMYLVMQDFNYPEILGRPEVFPKYAKFGERVLPTRMHTAPETGRRHRALGNIGVPLKFDADAMRLTLAKTAHAFAVAEMGEDACEWFLPDMILGRGLPNELLVGAIPDANNTVISGGDKLPPLFHRIELRRVVTALKGDFLSCEITFFEPLGMPKYQVLVGRPNKPITSGDAISSFIQDL